jgi:hypothetical protein
MKLGRLYVWNEFWSSSETNSNIPIERKEMSSDWGTGFSTQSIDVHDDDLSKCWRPSATDWELLADDQRFEMWQFSCEMWRSNLSVHRPICAIVTHSLGLGWVGNFGTQYAVQETKSYIQHWIPLTIATSSRLLRHFYGPIGNLINNKDHILSITSSSKVFHNIYKSYLTQSNVKMHKNIVNFRICYAF